MVGHFGLSDWGWLPWTRRKYRVSQVVDAADEVPQRLPRDTAVVVGTLEHPKWIAFNCPCSEQHRILLNLDPHRRPAWSLRSVKPLSLYPSIDYQGAVKRCHYIIRKGKVLWIPNSDFGE